MHATDIDLTGKDIAGLTSPDALATFLERLGYQTTARTPLTAESIGLSGEAAATFRKIELLSEDDEGFLRVLFAQVRSLTARARNDLVSVLRKSTIDHLLSLSCSPTTRSWSSCSSTSARRTTSRPPGASVQGGCYCTLARSM
jgi:hypothetical protein